MKCFRRLITGASFFSAVILLSAAFGVSSLAFAVKCPTLAIAEIQSDLKEFTRKVDLLDASLVISTSFECELAEDFDVPAYNGFYDGSRHVLHYRIPKTWTHETLVGPIAHEFGHAVWSAFTEKQFQSQRLNQIVANYSQAEKSILPEVRKLERELEVLHFKNPKSKKMRALFYRLDIANEKLSKLLQVDGLAQLYYATDELMADAVSVYLNQDLKANTSGEKGSHRDFSTEYSVQGWTERLYESRHLGDIYDILTPVRFHMGKKIVSENFETATTDMKKILESVRVYLESRSTVLTERPDEVNWDAENQGIIDAVSKNN